MPAHAVADDRDARRARRAENGVDLGRDLVREHLDRRERRAVGERVHRPDPPGDEVAAQAEQRTRVAQHAVQQQHRRPGGRGRRIAHQPAIQRHTWARPADRAQFVPEEADARREPDPQLRRRAECERPTPARTSGRDREQHACIGERRARDVLSTDSRRRRWPLRPMRRSTRRHRQSEARARSQSSWCAVIAPCRRQFSESNAPGAPDCPASGRPAQRARSGRRRRVRDRRSPARSSAVSMSAPARASGPGHARSRRLLRGLRAGSVGTEARPDDLRASSNCNRRRTRPCWRRRAGRRRRRHRRRSGCRPGCEAGTPVESSRGTCRREPVGAFALRQRSSRALVHWPNSVVAPLVVSVTSIRPLLQPALALSATPCAVAAASASDGARRGEHDRKNTKNARGLGRSAHIPPLFNSSLEAMMRSRVPPASGSAKNGTKTGGADAFSCWIRATNQRFVPNRR